MKVSFYGAASTVTGSKFLLEFKDTKVLIDCGIYQGLKELRLKNWMPFPFDPSELSAVVLSHAHIDHSGAIPILIDQGFKGRIYTTQATKELCSILLPDCGYLQEEDARFANRMGFSKHNPARPLYTAKQGEDAIGFFTPVEWDEKFKVGEFSFELKKAGHILGASSVKVNCSNGHNMLFSGDLGRNDDLIELNPDSPPEADWVVLESTYGNRLHPSDDSVLKMAEVINHTIDKEGVLLIPAFAVGRTQALLRCIERAFATKASKQIPVYVDSPMATRVTKLYQRFLGNHRLTADECYETCHIAKFTSGVEDSKSLANVIRPAIILSASGMLTGGRVLHHLQNLLGDPKNTVLLAGFQAPGTRGHTLARGKKELKFHGKMHPVNAEILNMGHFSGHADQKGLMDWVLSSPKTPKGICLVHGEDEALEALSKKVQENYHFQPIVPKYGDTLDLSKGKLLTK